MDDMILLVLSHTLISNIPKIQLKENVGIIQSIYDPNQGY